MLKWLTITLISFTTLTFSQSEFHHLVKFKYKAWGDLSNPYLYLSEKALEKRESINFDLDSSDIPINPLFLSEVSQFSLSVETKSKWFNCIVVASDNDNVKDSILALNSVDTVYLIGERNLGKTSINKFDYNESYEFIESLNLIDAHNKNLTGKGVDIAVIDAGFKNVNLANPYDHLFDENRVKSTYNFVSNQPISYDTHTHGANVTSFIGGKKDSLYVGTAPDANFHFLITEDLTQENKIEEFHLIEAIEYCDSAGVDLVNISLGYYTFDDTRFSHFKNEFTGNSTLLNKACNLGWKKGLFILSSAGNSGNDTWEVTTSPGNADSVLTIGSVNNSLARSGFSSKGNPYFLNNQKPNLVAIGEGVKALNSSGNVSGVGGTSFACPQITGFTACLMQAFPNKRNWELKKAIEKSAHNYYSPDSLIGYGVPNFDKAFLFLYEEDNDPNDNDNLLVPNPNNGNFILKNNLGSVTITIYNSSGKKVIKLESNDELIEFNNLELSSGLYFLVNQSELKKVVTKFIVF